MSGGPDSVGYAAIWKSRDCKIHPLVFDYGQKGRKEVEVLESLRPKLGFEREVTVNISSLKDLWSNTQLTDPKVSVEPEYATNVVVPLRNGVFLMIASAYADSMGAELVIYGAHLSDAAKHRGTGEPLYPDCTPEFAIALEEAINRGRFVTSGKRIGIQSPAREGLTKPQLLRKAYDIIGDLIFETWSCYLSGYFHCGICESCKNRRLAFVEAGIQDKTRYLK
jgi:7-cyano-7-deazaguanine synthase